MYYFTHLLKEIYQNQPFFLFGHICVNSVEVRFQMFIARLEAHGPILFTSFMFLLDIRENK